MFLQFFAADLHIEAPVIHAGPGHVALQSWREALFAHFFQPGRGYYQLAGSQSSQLYLQGIVALALAQPEVAGGEVQQGQAIFFLAGTESEQEITFGGAQQIIVQQRARRDDLDYIAFHQAFGQPGVLHLLGHCHFQAGLEDACDIVAQRMMRHAAHGHAAAGRQHHVHVWGGGLGVLKKKLVEIAHAKQQYGVFGQVVLQLPVLPHGRSQFTDITHSTTV